MAQLGAGAEKRELLPENDASFYTKEDRRQTFNFIKDEKGQVTFLDPSKVLPPAH